MITGTNIGLGDLSNLMPHPEKGMAVMTSHACGALQTKIKRGDASGQSLSLARQSHFKQATSTTIVTQRDSFGIGKLEG